MYLYTNSKAMAQHLCKGDEPSDEYFMRNGIIAYWRKANAVHRWFVENVQGGNDDCGTYEVSVEQLRELRDTVDKVLNSTRLVKGQVKNGGMYVGNEFVDCISDGLVLEDTTVAKELLPTQGGFFFGGTDYDQWYWEDLQYTKDVLDVILGCIEEGRHSWDYHFKGEDDWNLVIRYHASW